jgi:hypothetical protein
MLNFTNISEIYKILFTYQADLIITFAMFYIVILSGNIRGLFTCRQTNFFEKNKSAVLFTSFILFYFLCSLVSNTGHLKYVPPIQKLLYTVIYFLLFLLTTRLDFKVTFAVLGVIFLIYFIELNKTFYLKNKDSSDHNKNKFTHIYNNADDNADADDLTHDYNNHWITLDFPYKIRLFAIKNDHFIVLEKIEKILYVIIYVLTILGLIAYGGEIKDTLKTKNNVTWFDVFADTKVCKIKDKRPFTHYLKLGMGLKI